MRKLVHPAKDTHDLPERGFASHNEPVTTAKKHANKVEFEGILTRLDEPSDGVPKGAHHRRVMLTTKAAEEALPGLIGMAVNFHPEWDRHDRRRKCGVITGAEIRGRELHVSGYLFAFDFPELLEKLSEPGTDMGMSYDLIDAHVRDMRSDVYEIDRCTFIGAAIMFRTEAAFKTTSLRLASVEASEEKFEGAITLVSGVIVKTPD